MAQTTQTRGRPQIEETEREEGGMKECRDACNECADVCFETVNYCLDQGGEHVEPAHLKIMQDCAQICRTTADFLARESEHQGDVARACAEVCNACAESCEQFEGDPTMAECAEACRLCAESCDQMAD